MCSRGLQRNMRLFVAARPTVGGQLVLTPQLGGVPFSLPEFMDFILFWEDHFGGKQKVWTCFGQSTQEARTFGLPFRTQEKHRVASSKADTQKGPPLDGLSFKGKPKGNQPPEGVVELIGDTKRLVWLRTTMVLYGTYVGMCHHGTHKTGFSVSADFINHPCKNHTHTPMWRNCF